MFSATVSIPEDPLGGKRITCLVTKQLLGLIMIGGLKTTDRKSDRRP